MYWVHKFDSLTGFRIRSTNMTGLEAWWDYTILIEAYVFNGSEPLITVDRDNGNTTNRTMSEGKCWIYAVFEQSLNCVRMCGVHARVLVILLITSDAARVKFELAPHENVG